MGLFLLPASARPLKANKAGGLFHPSVSIIIVTPQDNTILIRRPSIPALFAVLCLFLCAFGQAEADTVRQEKFASPSGRYAVVFTEMENRKYSKEEMLEDLEHVSNILYRVDFIAKGAIDPAASSSYADVYGWERRQAGEGLFNIQKAHLEPQRRLRHIPFGELGRPAWRVAVEGRGAKPRGSGGRRPKSRSASWSGSTSSLS